MLFRSGGDLSEEINEFKQSNRDAHVELYSINSKLKDEFFETKKIVFVN